MGTKKPARGGLDGLHRDQVFFQTSHMKNAAPMATAIKSSALGLLRSKIEPATALTMVAAMPTAKTAPDVLSPKT